MARPGVTYLDVANAAQKLVAAGKPPTIETIRITLGTGSNSTLGAHLRNWKAKQDQTQHIATKENIPNELIASLKGLWERVMEQSEDKIQAIQLETQKDLTVLKHEIQRLQHDNAHWQQQYKQVKQERDGFANENSTVDQLLSGARVEIAALTEKLAGAEQQNRDKQIRVDELNRQNQQIQANLEHYRAASLEQRMADQLRYEQQQKQLEATIQHVNQELSQSKRDMMVWQQESQQIGFENRSLKDQLDKINLQYEVATDRLTEALSELTKKTQQLQHWQTQYETVKIQIDDQYKLLLDLQTRQAILSQQLKASNTELEVVAEQNKILSQEKWLLGQEKAQLYGQFKQLESYGVSKIKSA